MEAFQKWTRFAKAVAHFSECDGFASINVIEATELCTTGCIQNDWWEYDPPHHHLYLMLDGSTVDVTEHIKKAEEDYRKLSESTTRRQRVQRLLDAVDEKDPWEIESEKHPNLIYYVVEAKAGLVAVGAKYPVRHGFWTRIYSADFDRAIDTTLALWDKESKLTEEEQKADDAKNPVPWHEIFYLKSMKEDSARPLLDYFSDMTPKEQVTTIEKFSNHRLYNIAKNIKEWKQDIYNLEHCFKGVLEDPELQRFIEKQERAKVAKRKRRRKAGNKPRRATSLFTELEKESKLLKEFLESWKRK